MQIACQLALLVPSLGSARVLFRSAAFGISLVALTVTASNRTTKRHPGAVFVLFILFVLGLEAFHSDTNGPLAALATLAMNSAVLGPLIWAPRLAIDKKWFRRTVLLFWAFQSTSALVGALQSYFPNTFQPVTPFLDKQALAGLTIALANGESILRPSGLTDTPGGAAVAGTYAAILSLGLWFEFAKIWQRAIFVFTMAIGIYTIYLGQVRSLLLMVAISMLVIAGVYAVSGKLRNAVGLTILVVAIAGGSFVAAVGIGGDEVTNRFRTLVEGAPSDVYYANRGRFLEQTVDQTLPEFPLGAGLGRWGMVGNYFGGTVSRPLYVEIQWTGWVLDGGFLLLGAWLVMFGALFWNIWRIGRARSDLLPWVATVTGYSVGTVALTFNVAVFATNFGMDFFLLNGALFALSLRDETRSSTNEPATVPR